MRVDKHNDTFKVVSCAAGMAIVCNPLNGMFYVTIDNGPGLAKNLSPRSYGDIGFDNPSEAFNKLKEYVVEKFAIARKQFDALEVPHEKHDG